MSEMTHRNCTFCGKSKKLSEFYKDRTHPWGTRTRCKECIGLINHGEAARRAKSGYDRERYKKTRAEKIEQQRVYRRELREAALDHYGGKCACCGEDRYEFLAIDHIDGGGEDHRKAIKRIPIERWLKNRGYPSGFRVLCHNCNMALGLYGYCPHESPSEVAVVGD